MMNRTGRMAITTLLASCLSVGAANLATAQDSKPEADSDRAADASNKDSKSTMDSQSGAEKKQTAKSGNHPVVVLVPVVYAADTTLADGCWARLYDSQNFKGNMLTLVGPVDVPRTRPTSVTGYEFGTNYDSVMVGPNATLRVWDGSNYGDQAATFTSGQNIADTSTRMGEFEDIESLKVSCKS